MNSIQFKKEKSKKFRERFLKNSILYIIMILIAVLMVFPFLWTFLSSVKSQSENISQVFKLLPEGNIFEWEWSNYSTAIESMDFMRGLVNTLIITIPKLFGDIFVSACVAYGFSRFDFPYKKQIFLVLLASLMVPFEVTMVPLYYVYSQMGWINTYLPLILPSIFGASQFIFFLTMYFMTMPEDIISAAKIDGLNDFEIFTKMYIPISIPAFVVVGIWSFQGSWNDLLGPLIWLQSAEKFTLQLSLASLSNTTTYHVEQGVILAATILVMIPILILFISLQRYILESSKTSGIKG